MRIVLVSTPFVYVTRDFIEVQLSKCRRHVNLRFIIQDVCAYLSITVYCEKIKKNNYCLHPTILWLGAKRDSVVRYDLLFRKSTV